MSQKPDHYEVLGVAKNASVQEIQAAYKKIVMRCHPDRVRDKPEAERKAAAEKLQLATEAKDVLTDQIKRSAYDLYGHDGVESGKSGKTATTVHMPTRREMHTNEDIFDFFTKKGEEHKAGQDQDDKPRESPAERAARAAEERRKAREAARNKATAQTGTETPAQPSASDAFNEVADMTAKAADRLREAALPVEVLEKFRDNLRDFLKEVDAAVERARKRGGPDRKP